MYRRDEYIDISTRGTVAKHLVSLAKAGQIKECVHLRLDRVRGWYHPCCTKDFAEKVRATNVGLDITAYSGPSGYWWPKCPADCPLYTPLEAGQSALVSFSR